jgi:hypothetical protein
MWCDWVDLLHGPRRGPWLDRHHTTGEGAAAEEFPIQKAYERSYRALPAAHWRIVHNKTGSLRPATTCLLDPQTHTSSHITRGWDESLLMSCLLTMLSP